MNDLNADMLSYEAWIKEADGRIFTSKIGSGPPLVKPRPGDGYTRIDEPDMVKITHVHHPGWRIYRKATLRPLSWLIDQLVERGLSPATACRKIKAAIEQDREAASPDRGQVYMTGPVYHGWSPPIYPSPLTEALCEDDAAISRLMRY